MFKAESIKSNTYPCGGLYLSGLGVCKSMIDGILTNTRTASARSSKSFHTTEFSYNCLALLHGACESSCDCFSSFFLSPPRPEDNRLWTSNLGLQTSQEMRGFLGVPFSEPKDKRKLF